MTSEKIKKEKNNLTIMQASFSDAVNFLKKLALDKGYKSLEGFNSGDYEFGLFNDNAFVQLENEIKTKAEDESLISHDEFDILMDLLKINKSPEVSLKEVEKIELERGVILPAQYKNLVSKYGVDLTYGKSELPLVNFFSVTGKHSLWNYKSKNKMVDWLIPFKYDEGSIYGYAVYTDAAGQDICVDDIGYYDIEYIYDDDDEEEDEEIEEDIEVECEDLDVTKFNYHSTYLFVLNELLMAIGFNIASEIRTN